MPAMDDFVLFDGDLAIFNPNFGQAVVMVQPGRLKASGALSLNGRKACVAGDEQQVFVVGCPYITPLYPIPGMGTLRIAALGTGQTTKRSASDGKALLIKGDHFVAGFDVQAPARQVQAGSPATAPDPTPRYAGQGSFLPEMPVLKAS